MNTYLNEDQVHAGLEGVVATTTRLSRVDGAAGQLIIAGYPLETVAPVAGFEELLFILWHDRKPDKMELAQFKADLAGYRRLAPGAVALLRDAVTAGVDGMNALQMAGASLSLARAVRSNRDEALAAVAGLPCLAAAWYRLRKGLEPVEPREDVDHAAHFLYSLKGNEPNPAHSRALETYLNTVMDHGLNASTFTARVIVSTRSDMISAVVGALGALKGPLHGGAPGPALDMVFEIGELAAVEPVLQAKLENGERLMGFGHRVYKVRDPRAEVLAAAARRLFTEAGDMKLFELAGEVEQTAVRLLAQYKPGRGLQTNVEFYTALLLHGLGLPTEMFTPTFAVGRVAGWTAHCFEQIQQDKLIRPKALYVGAEHTSFEAVCA